MAEDDVEEPESLNILVDRLAEVRQKVTLTIFKYSTSN